MSMLRKWSHRCKSTALMDGCVVTSRQSIFGTIKVNASPLCIGTTSNCSFLPCRFSGVRLKIKSENVTASFA